MPVVFEDISAEVAPPAAAPTGAPSSAGATPAPEQLAALLQQQLAIEAERSARLRAD